jgi:hypothetical protein
MAQILTVIALCALGGYLLWRYKSLTASRSEFVSIALSLALTSSRTF